MYSSVISAAAAGILALGSTAPAASTPPTPPPDPVWLVLSAHSGHPGEKVSITVACLDETGPLVTKALRVTEPLAPNAEGHQPWKLFGESVVADVRPGLYPVSFTCAGKPVTVHFLVLAKEIHRQVTAVPKGAPQTGDGSSGQN
jgi:hypothetical protein